MKTTVIYTAAFFILCLTGMKCKKTNSEPKEELPAETMEGKRTFGCLVNGNIWLFRDKFPYSGLTATIQFEILSLGASRSNEGIQIGIREVKDIGTYSIATVNNRAEYGKGSNNYKATEGSLIITKYDKVNKIISGRFWFKGKNENGETVDIENGRFDVKYTD